MAEAALSPEDLNDGAELQPLRTDVGSSPDDDPTPTPRTRGRAPSATEKPYEAHYFRGRPIKQTFLDIASAFVIFYRHTFTIETLFILCVAIASTLFYLEYRTEEGDMIATKLDFGTLSIAIVFPLTFSIQQAFSRRENALDELGEFKAILLNVHLALLTWDFTPGCGVAKPPTKWSGRQYLPTNFEEQCHRMASKLVKEMREYLKAPTVTRARHLVLSQHQEKARKGWASEAVAAARIGALIEESFDLVEELKERGMPGNEAARINQYNMFLQQRFEKLRNYKWYRTPQAPRSFGRVYILILPWFYGPYFAYINRDTSYTFAIALSCLTSIVLIGLINVQRSLEDPFTEEGIDSIHVGHDLKETQKVLDEQLKRGKAKQRPRVEYNPVVDNLQ